MKNMMPVIFIGHGSPENAIEKNEFSDSWKELAKIIPRPRFILCISAHWETKDSQVTAMDEPRTIHDFYGFPKKLYETDYDAKGSMEFAQLVKDRIKSVDVKLNNDWGLDHGTWSVLINMYPKSDIPVLQLSINNELSYKQHFNIGKELAGLRDNGVLIIGSGNVVHNLGLMKMDDKPFDWAIEFDDFVKDRLLNKDFNSLIEYKKQRSARLALPTDEHYIPLLYIAGASLEQVPEFFNEKIFYSSLSMRCVVYGLPLENFNKKLV